jgi:SAM-dependent methyltransferase
MDRDTIDTASVRQDLLFDELAPSYDLLLGDWEQDLEAQGRLLDRLFRTHGDRPITTVLDCTCGIGTQCIGLAKLGYRVTGTDVSTRSVARAQREAERFGVSVDFRAADLRRLSQTLPERFDAVISCDNSLPYLLSREDLDAALQSMFDCLEPGGLCVISIRNFDRIFRERKRFSPRHIHDVNGKRIIIFDVWDYHGDELVTFNVFFLREEASGWRADCHPMVLRALYREDLKAALQRSGFRSVDILDNLDGNPLQFDFYLCGKPR